MIKEMTEDKIMEEKTMVNQITEVEKETGDMMMVMMDITKMVLLK